MTVKRWIISLICVLSSAIVANAQSLESPFVIEAGSIEGNINDLFVGTFYSFDVIADDVVTITMTATSGDLDPFLNLRTPDGEILQFNDDVEGSGSRDAMIEFTADEEGTFIIETTRFDGLDGLTTGTYRLTLDIQGALQTPVEVDPLSLPPPFAVDAITIEYGSLDIVGNLDEVVTERYYAFGGRQGDFVRATTTVTSGNLRPQVTIRNADSTVISNSQLNNNETTTLATLPEVGWYLIEVKRESGAGQFRLFVEPLAQSVLEPAKPVSGVLTETVPTLSYVFNGTINDTILASAELTAFNENSSTQPVPQITVLDLNQKVIADHTSSTRRASVITELPRSGAYIVQVSTSGTRVGGEVEVSLLRSQFDVEKLNVRDARYNDSYRGIISDGLSVQYFRFIGKAGELVTIDMRADDTMMLDPFLILLDGNLNELAFNDTTGNSANARITQFTIPENGEYYIIATRAGLEEGTSQGRYTLSMTVGQIELLTGNFTATLNWTGDADLNLFVSEPTGRVISWSNPESPNGGALQIDSNTNCETPTSQPVEHVYYPNAATVPTGDYTVWVWYQNVCSMGEPVPFTLVLSAYNQQLLKIESTPENPVTIAPNQRFEAVVRVNAPSGTVITPGEFSSPTPQITASQGGDTLIRYGEIFSDSLNNLVYARFYQFMGEPNDRVIITVETQTGNLDPIVILRTPDDVNLALNDDIAPSNKNSRIEYTLEQAGQYVIAVTRYGLRDGTTTGSYNLSIVRDNSN